MTWPEILGLVLGSAGVGALVSGIVNGVFNWRLKRHELERRDLEMALKMAELKHHQIITVYQWHAAKGGDPAVTFIDPLMSVIGYHTGMEEYRETGVWHRGQAGHLQGGADVPEASAADHGALSRSTSGRRGWLRLGVVFSIAWALGVGGVAGFEYFVARHSEGRWFVAYVSGSVPDPKYPGFVPDVPSARLGLLATVVGGPLAAGWILVPIAVAAGSWVRAGFRA